ncbi:hypothetical protein [Poseidonibacter ostreae]|uniref:Uncharacterized protein n=1 Tax=Poseidonibacter ostreae TaxID=2654171 RepID=A0A6L4WU66_9BACT|nr:hypothetical protein [Poseidonibacter ostreae]KAB7889744.1 hypothetical protein GBG19_05015 [Poseidonibacter ostreae]
MIIKKNIAKFFEYDKLELIGTLITSTIFIIRNHDKNNYLIDEILEASNINLEAPLFLKELEDQLDLLNKDNDSIYFSSELRHSPSALQNSPISWQYYSIYFAFNLKNEDIHTSKEDPVLNDLLKSALHFHNYYLKYKDLEEKEKLHISERQQAHFYKSISIGVVRTIEYLAKFYLSKNEYLYEKYLVNQKDHFENLVELSNNDIVEKDCFFIVHDLKIGNFMKYENKELAISIQVLSSRKITSGASIGKEFNSKITFYLSTAFESYKKLIRLHLKKSKGNSGGASRKNDLQATEEEKFIFEEDIEDLSLESENKEQINELKQRSVKKARSSLVPADDSVDETKNIGNRFMQYKKNISFSSSITKSKLLLKTEYRIPEVGHLREFINYLSLKNNTNFNEIEDFSKAIFILSIIFGFNIDDAILFLHNENKNIKRLKNGKISAAIDSELFAKYRVNPVLQKRTFTINYVLQDYIYRLINKLEKYLLHFSNLAYYFKNMRWARVSAEPLVKISNSSIRSIVNKNIIDNFSKFKDDYLSSMKKLIKEFDKEIKIDLKNMWKITLRFSKIFFGDDTIAMLSIAKYQKNDTAKLSYASTEKFSQKHSLLVEKICNALNLPNVVSKLLDIDSEVYNHTFRSVEPVFVGSHRAVNYKSSIKFFEKMYELIFEEDDKIKKINLVSIYIRYAMSILCATRDFKNSSTIRNISFSMHTQMITEKSDSKLSGIRIIPLCETIEKLIKYYYKICEQMGVKLDYISLYDNDKFVKYETKVAFKIIEDITNDKLINDFIKYVPVNTGRHIINQYKIEKKLNATYIETFLGHYISGAEQIGIYSPLDMQRYIHYIRDTMQNIAKLYTIRELS